MGSILNHTAGRRLEHFASLRIPAILIVLVLSVSSAQARAESGWKLIAANRTVSRGPELRDMARKPGSPDPLLANLLLQGVACPDARTCFVAGTHEAQNAGDQRLVILVTRDRGASWSTAHKQPGSATGLLSCPGPRQCYSIGLPFFNGSPLTTRLSLLRTTDGGKSWQRSNVGPSPTVDFFPTSLTCPSATVCYIIAMAFSPGGANGAARSQPLLIATKDSGTSWTAIHLSAVKNLRLQAIACSTTTSCTVGGTTQEKSCFQAAAILHTNDGGRTWNRQFGDCAAAISALACPSARTCYAGGWYGPPDANGNQLVLRTADGGATWDDSLVGPIDPAYVPGNSIPQPIAGIACPDAQVCFLSAGNHILATADGGGTWRNQAPVANAILTAISCPTIRACVSVGSIPPPQSGPGPPRPTSLILRTVDGGKTWTRL